MLRTSRQTPARLGNDWSCHEHRGISLPPRRPGFICAQLRRCDGSALRDGAALGRKSKQTPPGVPRWVPLMLEMDRTVSRKPPDDAASRPRPDRMTRGTILAGNNLLAAVCRTSLASREVWGYMSSNSDINEYYHLVVRRGAVGRKQFVWEIQDNDTVRVLQSSEKPFATMEEALRSGLSALACLTD
jgi:hypothetical protein